ncbi:hypothetical protein E3P86_02426 [Wallemia ichthyophaga]|uniref:DNA-(apurinic or apyrimidinic site) endonuclease 2 n=1 Tax=Wallemia ichthyophaga TaxID=245174 RepID=A0A4T0J213_WALIC|nr:hypothetical protein E3P86_02426 [Wallemia ichthyophaga]
MALDCVILRNQCFQVECANCNKQTWSGCGLHKNAVLEKIPKEDRCSCKNTFKNPPIDVDDLNAMRILSWNINGTRRILRNYQNCDDMLRSLDADIVCVQETKMLKGAVNSSQAILHGFDSYWSFCHSRSYSGVCIYTRYKALAAEEGLSGGYTTYSLSLPPLAYNQRVQPVSEIHKHNDDTLLAHNYHPENTNIKQLDTEGRTLVLDFGFFVLINVYCPAEGENRGHYKHSFHEMLFERVKQLKDAGRQVILLGDLNVAHRPFDHCDGIDLTRTDTGRMEFAAKYTRKWMDRLVSHSDSPLVDVARLLHPNKEGMFTCWNQVINARPSNYGTRIDYVLVTPGLLPWIKEAEIAPHVYNSDHCPVYIDLHDEMVIKDGNGERAVRLIDLLPPADTSTPPLCAANWDEFNGKQTSLARFLKVGKRSQAINESALQNGPQSQSQSQSQLQQESTKHSPQQPKIESFFQPRTRTLDDTHTTPSSPRKYRKDNDTATKTAWKALMAPKKVPKCKVHKEDCKEYTVNKPGPNKGKQFWLCKRDVGPGYDASGSSNFDNLDKQLRGLDSGVVTIPPKHLLRFRQSTNEPVIKERVDGFNKYLHFIISSRNPIWRDSREFKAFICLQAQTRGAFNWMESYRTLSNQLRVLKGLVYKSDKSARKELFVCLAKLRELQLNLDTTKQSISSNEFNSRHQLLLSLVDQVDLIELMLKDTSKQNKQPEQPKTLSFNRQSKPVETEETRPLDSTQLHTLQSTKMASQDTQIEQISLRLQRQLEMGLAINSEVAQHNELLDSLDGSLNNFDSFCSNQPRSICNPVAGEMRNLLKLKDCTSITPNYASLSSKLSKVRQLLGNEAKLTLAEKILYSHLHSPEDSLAGKTHSSLRGQAYLKLSPDRVAMQDASAQMALLQFMTCGLSTTAVPTSIHCDHLIQAYEGAAADLKRSIVSNKEVFDFLESASKKYGIEFWKPGSGIIHQLVLENYAAPGMLMLGTDSHTPNAGGMGMLAIGVGGADAVDGMSGTPWELKAPKVIGVKLTGEMNGWTTPKDLILHLAGKLTVKGGTGSILEYFGPGLNTQSCTGLATIANMGAEVGATTSTFPYSQSMRSYLHATGRGPVAEAADDVNAQHSFLKADAGAEYDDVIEINLSELEPHINGPFTPDLSTPLSKFSAMVKENNWPSTLSAGLIGSCTNSSYEDMSRVESIANQAKNANRIAAVPFMVTPGSELIRATIERDGVQSTLETVGATVLANACGPCIGQWDRKEAQSEDNAILTSFNRNFKARNDGNMKTMNFLASPEIVTAMTIAGNMTFNPMTDTIPAEGEKKALKFEPPHGTFLPADGFEVGDETFSPRPTPQPIPETEVNIDKSSNRLEILEPFESHFENSEQPTELSGLQCLMRVRGKCTTDHISAAGPWLKYKGHLSNISENTLMTAVNDENGNVNSAYDFFNGKYNTIPNVGKEYKRERKPWMLVVDENYGEGSAREHASMQPRWLGCAIVLGRSLARIHETNLKKQGILPLTFANKEDYSKIDAGDDISTQGLVELFGGALDTPLSVNVEKKDGRKLSIPVNHTMSVDQLTWLRYGSALNAIAAAAKKRQE